MKKSSNYGEVPTIGSSNNFQISTTKHGLNLSQCLEGYTCIPINSLEKVCDIRLFSGFLFFPINVMVDFSDRLDNPIPSLSKG